MILTRTRRRHLVAPFALGALRRLGKETCVFDYVGESHGLRRRGNQKDWVRRVQEHPCIERDRVV